MKEKKITLFFLAMQMYALLTLKSLLNKAIHLKKKDAEVIIDINC